jgi:integrase
MARPRGKKFQADVVINGVRRRPSFATLAEANAYEMSVAKGFPHINSLSFKRFHQDNFEYLWGDNKAPQATRYSLDSLDEFIPAWTPITEIKAPYILDLVSKMKKTRVSNATINRRLSALSRLLKHAERLEVIPKRPHIEFLREAHGRERVLSDREEAAVDRYLRHMGMLEARAVALFLLYTGCRLGEVFSLTRERVRDGRVTFEYSLTKTAQTRVVPLVGPAKEAWEFMSRQSAEDCPFSVYPVDTFRNHWQRLREHLKLLDDKEFVPHMLRHTCASRLVSKGIPLFKVMQWMGHKSIETTLRYSHLVPDDLDAAGKALWDK